MLSHDLPHFLKIEEWGFLIPVSYDDLVNSPRDDGFECRGVRRTPIFGRAQLAPT